VTTSIDFSWMRVVLRSLFDESTPVTARAAITSPDSLAELRRDLEMRVLAAGKLGRIPTGEFGDNLLMALIALRLKFPLEEAFEKLEINIAMRERRGAG